MTKQVKRKKRISRSTATFADAAAMWMNSNKIRLKGSSVHKYQYILDKHLLPEIGDRKLTSFTASELNEYFKDKLDNGGRNGSSLSPSYARNMVIIVNAVIRYATNEGLCEPLLNSVYPPKIEKKDIVVLTHEEQRALEHYISIVKNNISIGIMITLHTGLRAGEICALSWNDIDFTNRIIRVRHTVSRVEKIKGDSTTTKLIIDSPKTGTSLRDIPITENLYIRLLEHKEQSVSPYVVSTSDTFLSTRTYDYQYHKVLKACGIPFKNYHVLRHTFATRFIESGMDVKSLSEILGHANAAITLNIYVHPSMELKRIQMERMVQICSGTV